jgi:hypothetical protein
MHNQTYAPTYDPVWLRLVWSGLVQLGHGIRNPKYETHPAGIAIGDERNSRFILNLPEEELASPERICFQVEQA